MSRPNDAFSKPLIDIHQFDNVPVQFEQSTEWTAEQLSQSTDRCIGRMEYSTSRQLLIGLLRDRTPKQYNGVNVQVVLAEIESMAPNPDIWSIVDEQLHDSYTKGQCAQGLVKRLIQVWTALHDHECMLT